MKRWLVLVLTALAVMVILSTSPARTAQAASVSPTTTSSNYKLYIKQSSHIYFAPTYPACVPTGVKTANVTVTNTSRVTVYLWLNYWLLATLKPGQQITGALSMTGLDVFTFDIATVKYTGPRDATSTILSC